MIKIPVLRWGEPYESLENDEVIHHRTGEVLATVGQANPGLLARDMRTANRAREALREIPIKDLVEMMKRPATCTSTRRCRSAMVSSRPMTSRGSSPPPPVCPSTCASSTWRKTTSC